MKATTEKKPKPSKLRKRSVYISPVIAEAVADTAGDVTLPIIGGALSTRLGIVAARYMEITRAYLPVLTEAEWRVVMKALRGITKEGREFVHDNPMRLAKAVDEFLANPTNQLTSNRLDGDQSRALVTRLTAMHYAEAVALADHVERWWSLSERTGNPRLPLAAVGIDPYPPPSPPAPRRRRGAA